MAKSKIREISIVASTGGFSLFKKADDKLDFSDIASFRQLLANEKARLLHIIKTQKPDSIYALSKKAERTFKSTFDDVKLLERFGFIALVAHKKNNRNLLRPTLVVDSINVHIGF